MFNGVGGELISRVARVLLRGSSIYTYGFLGGDTPLSIHTSIILMKGLTIKGLVILLVKRYKILLSWRKHLMTLVR